MSAIVYLSRDNKFTLSLTQDGSAPTADAITKAALYVPGEAFVSGTARVFDTDGANATLTNSATKVQFDLGDVSIKAGSWFCYLTCYDAVNTDGIAWDTVTVQVKEWPASV